MVEKQLYSLKILAVKYLLYGYGMNVNRSNARNARLMVL
jgi:hypothetical protein